MFEPLWNLNVSNIKTKKSLSAQFCKFGSLGGTVLGRGWLKIVKI